MIAPVGKISLPPCYRLTYSGAPVFRFCFHSFISVSGRASFTPLRRITVWIIRACTRIGQTGASPQPRNPLSPELRAKLNLDRKSFTKEMERQVLATACKAPEDLRLLCQLLYVTGCRLSEALALRGDCIDTEEGLVVFHTLKQRGAERLRAVPVPERVAINLAHLATPQDRLWPFSRWTALRRIRTLLLEAGVPAHLAHTKTFRHSYNDRGKLAGTPDHVRRALLGHRTQTANDQYGALIGVELRAHAKPCWGRLKR
ncbi:MULTISPECIES: tyrosine-type recombinase/integrase [Jannaschia]|uniref:tyrosine-type recombinase/integrase n=1 Tax=Jannaschia TaxID=188905 RepID=UPI001C7CBF3D|nr:MULTISPECIES: tyrosine-type recombinase/integrase [unclassified Jannaschia]